jgi:hypothetical protein
VVRVVFSSSGSVASAVLSSSGGIAAVLLSSCFVVVLSSSGFVG